MSKSIEDILRKLEIEKQSRIDEENKINIERDKRFKIQREEWDRRSRMYESISSVQSSPISSSAGLIKSSGPNPLWSSLVAGWNLDGDFNDVLGVANGTPINGAGFTTGKINDGFNGVKAIDLASASYVDFGNSISQRNLTFPMTISAWIKQSYSTTSGGCIPIFLDGDVNSGARGGFWLQITNLNALGGSSRIRAGFGNGLAAPNGLRKEWWTDFVIPKDIWKHVVVVFTDANTISFYSDGSFVASSFLTGTATTVAWSGQKTIIGYSNNYGIINAGNPTFEGSIDETYIWNRVISQSEITELYNSGNGKQYPN